MKWAGRSGLPYAILGLASLLAAIGAARFTEQTQAGRLLVPLAAICFAQAAAPMIARRHPDEPWLPQFLVWAVAFKVVMVIARYHAFGGLGDAFIYDRYAREFVRGVAEPIEDLRKTGFVMWTAGHVYDWFGVDQITGFFVFGLFAFIGAYFWYRATADGVPIVNRKMYCALVFFLPSIAFWPASMGKESIMQFAIGAAALATSLALRRRLLVGILIALPAAYLMWAVRPHILAIVVVSAGVAYALGQRERPGDLLSTPTIGVGRALGIIALAVAAVFVVGEMMSFLGMDGLSIEAIETELEEVSQSTAQGGSEIQGQSELTPLSLPIGLVTVLVRPFIWEVESSTQIVAALEASLILALLIVRRRSIWLAFTRARRIPFLLFCWCSTALFALTFSAFSNMGLLVRQRSLALPAFFALLSVATPRQSPAEIGPDEGADEPHASTAPTT